MRGVLIGVVEVLMDPDAEQAFGILVGPIVETHCAAEIACERAPVGDRGDCGEVVGERRKAARFDGVAVGGARIIVANDARRTRPRVGSRVVNQAARTPGVFGAQRGCRIHAGRAFGEGRCSDPLAVGVGIEIVAGAHRCAHAASGVGGLGEGGARRH